MREKRETEEDSAISKFCGPRLWKKDANGNEVSLMGKGVHGSSSSVDIKAMMSMPSRKERIDTPIAWLGHVSS
jgi:hypothetical protein